MQKVNWIHRIMPISNNNNNDILWSLYVMYIYTHMARLWDNWSEHDIILTEDWDQNEESKGNFQEENKPLEKEMM